MVACPALQTYETLLVRHGFMVVGGPFSGKSSCLRVLAIALSECAHLRRLPCALHSHELPVSMYTMNPKVASLCAVGGSFRQAVSHSHAWLRTRAVCSR